MPVTPDLPPIDPYIVVPSHLNRRIDLRAYSHEDAIHRAIPGATDLRETWRQEGIGIVRDYVSRLADFGVNVKIRVYGDSRRMRS